MSVPPFISVVSPVYRAEKLVRPLVERITSAVARITPNYEIVLVDDRSPDASWEAIEAICQSHPKIAGVRLSRNFGQHYAISAGLQHARGEWIVVMDCDLQDQPEEIPKLLAQARAGYDIVLARRATRQDTWFKQLSSHLFYGVLGYLTQTAQDPTIANFGIYHRKVISAINTMPETIRYFPTMVRWVGFRRTTVDVVHAPRAEGETTYNWRKLFNLALDIILANSDKPLRLVVKTGFLISFVGFGFAAFTIVQALQGKIIVLGYASLIVSLWVLAGLIILIMGIVGLYVGKIFEGVKQRPAFIVSDRCGQTTSPEDPSTSS